MTWSSLVAGERRQFVSLFVLILIALFSLLIIPRKFIDDAYIVMRCAFNLRETGAPVFNPGEHVEACTDLLWVVCVAACSLVPGIEEPLAALLLSYGLLLFVGVRLWQLANLWGLNPWYGVGAAACLYLNPLFMMGNTIGLEGPLFNTLLIETIYRWQTGRLKLAFFVAGLLFYTRPEGAAVPFLLATICYFEGRSTKTLCAGLAISLGMIAGLTLFRWFYFHSLVPNSIVAKHFPLSLRGDYLYSTANYLESYYEANPQFIVLVLVGLWLIAGPLLAKLFRCTEQTKTDLPAEFYVCAFCLVELLLSALVVIRNAGDWMPYYRLFMQYGSLYGVLLLCLCRQRLLSSAVVIALIVVGLGQMTIMLRHRDFHIDQMDLLSRPLDPSYHTDVIPRLREVVRPDDVILSEVLGWSSYQLRHHQFHDPLGLADAYIARNGQTRVSFGKWNWPYSFGEVKPEVMLWPHTDQWSLELDPELINQYAIIYRPLKPEDRARHHPYLLLIRKDRMEELGPAFSDWPQITLEELIERTKQRHAQEK